MEYLLVSTVLTLYIRVKYVQDIFAAKWQKQICKQTILKDVNHIFKNNLLDTEIVFYLLIEIR